MKNISAVLGIGFVAALVGCASPVALAPVGPNPGTQFSSVADGQLEVFSSIQRLRDGGGSDFTVNTAWHQHTDYDIYDTKGNELRHVFNSLGHYDQQPRLITLPPGEYLIRAEAKDYVRVQVPVVIEQGRVTTVHLDDRWQIPANTSQAQLVYDSNGHAVGWRADSGKNSGSNN